MKAFFKELSIRTRNKLEVVNITHYVEDAVRESGIRDGICLVHAPHATAAIVANEYESGLVEDILTKIREEYPEDGRWKHNLIDYNAAAHLASAFIGASRIFPVRNGSLVRGTWQHILLIELDGPRTRRVVIEVLGE
ncbi:MAG: YjbQ family protein [Thermoprotei archaeon]|nr:MAG: YjbQ family protein [Thermoprotei archaeon]